MPRKEFAVHNNSKTHSHQHLVRAKSDKNDEYYTPFDAIAQEVQYYGHSFFGKTVYCNCDSPSSNFVLYFILNFYNLGLKHLIVTGIDGHYLDYNGRTTKEKLINGDFRSQDCRELLSQCDVVVSNPPFSLFREYFRTLVTAGVDFLVIGPKTAISYKEVFPLLATGRVQLGHTVPNTFINPEGGKVNLPGLCRWFTSFKSNTPKPTRLFTAAYDEKIYNHFDLYPAINCDRTEDIPCDFEGLMGVPITAIEHLDITRYTIVDLIARYAVINHSYDTPGHQLTEINGKPKFSRLIIKRKQSLLLNKAA